MENQVLFCHVSVAPLRASNSDTSEIVSQLLFGEGAILEETNENWIKIKSLQDGYEGWMDRKQVWSIDSVSWENWVQNSEVSFLTDYKVRVNGVRMQLPMGVRIGRNQQSFEFNNNTLFFEQTLQVAMNALEVARQLLHTPYLWGGRTNYGIDCSGLTQLCMKAVGIQLERDASQQEKQGRLVSFEDRKPNDLVFFKSASGKIHHVGLIDEQLHVIHAHGWVRIDDLTAHGIIRRTDNELSHQLFSIKRFDFTS